MSGNQAHDRPGPTERVGSRRSTAGLLAMATAWSIALVVVADASDVTAVVDETVYIDQVGLRIDGGSPVASATGDRVAVMAAAVEVYDWDGVRWSAVGDPISGGTARAMSGDGRRLVLADDADSVGRVQIFDWNGSGWVQLGGDLVGDAAGDVFGRVADISFDGNRVAIGAAGDADDPSPAGYVRVFDWDGSSWSPVGDDLVGDADGDGFGWSVAMSSDGDRLLVSGRPLGDYDTDVVDGVARVFDWNGSGWEQVGDDLDAAGDGTTMSASGDRVAIGYHGVGDPALPGRAWVFEWTGTWDLIDFTEGRQAQTISLSDDGRRLAFSGNFASQPIDTDAGTTVIRDELDGGSWADVRVITGEFYSSYDYRAILSAGGDRIVVGSLGVTRVFDISSTAFPPLAPPVSLQPARLYDSRFGADTVDGAMAGRGRRPAGSVTELPVTGRGGVPMDPSGVMLSVVAVNPDDAGHLTVFPCSDDVPLASNLNYVGGQAIANSVFTELSDSGTVCVFTFSATDLVVDVTGYSPFVRPALRPVEPHRLVDTRPDAPIGDGIVIPFGGIVITSYENWTEVDRLPAGSVTKFSVGGWPSRPVPLAATAVVLDVVAVDPAADGYLTVSPCSDEVPLASSVNYAAGRTIANLVVADIDPGYVQTLCLYTSATLDVVVDVTGYSLDDDDLSTFVPARLLDSRPGESTVDGIAAGIGRRPAGSITEVVVAGRGGVDPDATGAILNVVAVDPAADGHLTVFPCGTEPPLASNLNYATGQVIANSSFAKLSADGRVCIFTYAETDLVVDVTGGA